MPPLDASDREVILLHLRGMDEKFSARLDGMHATMESVSDRTTTIDGRLAEQNGRVHETVRELGKVRRDLDVLGVRVDEQGKALSTANRRMAAIVAGVTAFATTVVQQAWSNWDWIVKTVKSAGGAA